MRPHSSFVSDASTTRSPPSSPSGSPRPPPGKRPTLLKQLTSLLIVAIMLATTGSVTLVLSRVGESGRATEGPDARLRVAPLPLPPVESDDNLVSLFPLRHHNVTSTTPGAFPKVLILTPVKNSARHITRFFNNVRSLSYPHDRISIGLLESDSDDVPPSALLDQLSGLAKSIPALKVVLRKYEERYQAPPPGVGLAPMTGNASRPEALTPVPHPAHVHGLALAQSTRLSGTLAHILAEVPSLQADFGRVAVFQHDFGLSLSREERHAQSRQLARRGVLARSRNHLLLSALRDEEFVLWVDSDLVSYPPDIVQSLLSAGKQIVTPHCVMEPGGRSYDLNSWRAKGDKLGNNATLHDVRAYHLSIARKAMSSDDPRQLRVEGYENNPGHLYLQHLRGQGPVVRLDAVGGAMLLVDAELHRQGLVFPPFVYGYTGRIETEGLSMMALDMGVMSWGMPGVEIFHH